MKNVQLCSPLSWSCPINQRDPSRVTGIHKSKDFSRTKKKRPSSLLIACLFLVYLHFISQPFFTPTLNFLPPLQTKLFGSLFQRVPLSHSSFFSHYSHSKGQVCQPAESLATQANHPERGLGCWRRMSGRKLPCVGLILAAMRADNREWGPEPYLSHALLKGSCSLLVEAPSGNPNPTRCGVPLCWRAIHPQQSSELLLEEHHWTSARLLDATGIGTSPPKEASLRNVGFHLGISSSKSEDPALCFVFQSAPLPKNTRTVWLRKGLFLWKGQAR